MYCGPITASEVFIFTTQLYQYLDVVFLSALVSDEPDVFLPKYSQTAILPAAYFRWVVNIYIYVYVVCVYIYECTREVVIKQVSTILHYTTIGYSLHFDNIHV